jgi:hypothetical protein
MLRSFEGYQDPLLARQQQRLEGFGITPRGGGGGGGVREPFLFSREGVELSPDYQRAVQRQFRLERGLENPFGQGAVNVRVRDIDMALQQAIARINEKYGGQDVPARAEEIRQVTQDAQRQRATIQQQMAQSGGEFDLRRGELTQATMSSVGQIAAHMAQLNTQINIAQGQARADLLKQRRSLAASSARAQVALQLGIVDRMMRAEEASFDRFRGAWGQESQDYWTGQQMAEGGFRWQTELDYNRKFNEQMMEIQRESNKKDIWDIIGGIGGAVVGAFDVFGRRGE